MVITTSSSNNSIMNNNTEKVSLEYDVISNDGVDITKNDDGYVLKVKDKGTINIRLKNKLENKLLFIIYMVLRKIVVNMIILLCLLTIWIIC